MAPRSRTHAQQQPSPLKVRDGGDLEKRDAWTSALVYQNASPKASLPNGVPSTTIRCCSAGKEGGANPYWGAPRQRRKFRPKALRFLARSVPNPRFVEVQIYVGVLCQRSAEGTEGRDCAFGRARDVCVIQKCIQVLTRAEGGMGRWMPTANSPGINGSPCSPPSAWDTLWA